MSRPPPPSSAHRPRAFGSGTPPPTGMRARPAAGKASLPVRLQSLPGEASTAVGTGKLALLAGASAVAAVAFVAGFLATLRPAPPTEIAVKGDCFDLGQPIPSAQQKRVAVETTLDGDVNGPKMRDMRFLATAIEFCRPGSCPEKQVKELANLLDTYVATRVRQSAAYYRQGGHGGLHQVNRLYGMVEDKAIWRQIQYLSDAGTLDLDRHVREGRVIKMLLAQPDHEIGACGS